MASRGDVPREQVEHVLKILAGSIGPFHGVSDLLLARELRARRDIAIEELHKALGWTPPQGFSIEEFIRELHTSWKEEVGRG